MYEITVWDGSSTWTLLKRYSELRELHVQVSVALLASPDSSVVFSKTGKVSSLVDDGSLPSFPGRTIPFLEDANEPSFIVERRYVYFGTHSETKRPFRHAGRL